MRVRGIVQGVGFRPHVYALATSLGLTGFVLNDADGVLLEVEGSRDAVAQFARRLADEPPPLARIDAFETEPIPPVGGTGFRIEVSETGAERRTFVSPDVATCADCLREIGDPGDRRYRYPYTNCTNCGPRFTITRTVPYDRPNTTMDAFDMCEACAAEYHDPADRRFHAQAVACPVCGPRLRLVDPEGHLLPGDPIAEAARLLAAGAVLAVKGLGGYHLACDAADERGVAALRARKHREEKPFALMVPDLQWAHRLTDPGAADVDLLLSRRAPIVLMPRRRDAPVAASVAPGNRFLGLMLPYTPLHHLLLGEVGRPLVMTSGNVSDEPIAHRDEEALERLGAIADAFLVHDREIHVRCDDSVVRTWRAQPYPLRRSRGYAPEPLRLEDPVPVPVIAVGAELKHTFCLAKEHAAFLSHHIGDLENWETMRSFLEGVEHVVRIFDVTPEVVAYDPHPEYLSTKWALDQAAGEERPLPGVELAGLPAVAVQHHHAHVASCLADAGHPGPVIGLALDGTGWGPDGTIWGCELLVADLVGFRRAGHLRSVALPGGAAAIREPWRMAAAYLDAAFGDEGGVLPLEVVGRNRDRWAPVLELADKRINAPLASSAGRLFDAVAAICGLRDEVTYEGQAAIELEQAADPSEPSALPCPLSQVGEVLVLDGVALAGASARALVDGWPVARVAAAFHNGFADALVEACVRIRDASGPDTVALSGGTWQNLLLAERATAGLEREGFGVLRHRRVPANDGGIALGQVAVAAARIRTGVSG